jgi:hypothetical protein
MDTPSSYAYRPGSTRVTTCHRLQIRQNQTVYPSASHHSSGVGRLTPG